MCYLNPNDLKTIATIKPESEPPEIIAVGSLLPSTAMWLRRKTVVLDELIFNYELLNRT